MYSNNSSMIYYWEFSDIYSQKKYSFEKKVKNENKYNKYIQDGGGY